MPSSLPGDSRQWSESWRMWTTSLSADAGSHNAPDDTIYPHLAEFRRPCRAYPQMKHLGKMIAADGRPPTGVASQASVLLVLPRSLIGIAQAASLDPYEHDKMLTSLYDDHADDRSIAMLLVTAPYLSGGGGIRLLLRRIILQRPSVVVVMPILWAHHARQIWRLGVKTPTLLNIWEPQHPGGVEVNQQPNQDETEAQNHQAEALTPTAVNAQARRPGRSMTRLVL
ncbi:hypothetical protein B0I35DRAFT_516910 [Stachybotrys elegans]|uniref:Uncharacterized protein n=1 Tax=Stachybotrys elegans TaxID=80388 RepID=A0A8K0WKQ4_9HYPO|nr:hypothetical protein B0I35DRAFT_516910 [Stachybotrys elegans]